MYGIQWTSTDRLLSEEVKRSMAFVKRAWATWHHGQARSLYTFTSTFEEVAMADTFDRNVANTKEKMRSEGLGMLIFCFDGFLARAARARGQRQEASQDLVPR